MTVETHGFAWGSASIDFRVIRSNRKRLAIEVDPDGSVVVRAPKSLPQDELLLTVKRKARWIRKQQQFFDQFRPRTTPRQYVAGETHLYLGRRFRLKLHASDGEQRVALRGGYFHVYTNSPGDSKSVGSLLDAWYIEHAHATFEKRMAVCLDHRLFRQLVKRELVVRHMKRRWGSCSARGRISLNVDLIRAPRVCIDYVIVHELCHLIEPSHSSRFFDILRTAMPDWERRKSQLENTLV